MTILRTLNQTNKQRQRLQQTRDVIRDRQQPEQHNLMGLSRCKALRLLTTIIKAHNKLLFNLRKADLNAITTVLRVLKALTW